MELNIQDIKAIGEVLYRSGMLGLERIEQGWLIALISQTENITISEFISRYDIVAGKLRKKTLAAFAQFRKAGGKVVWIKNGEDKKEARAKFIFEGQELELSYTIEQARAAGLVRPRGVWEVYTANMLRVRLISNALAMLCPEVYSDVDEYSENEPPVKELSLKTIAENREQKPVQIEVINAETTKTDEPKQVFEPKIENVEIKQEIKKQAQQEIKPEPIPEVKKEEQQQTAITTESSVAPVKIEVQEQSPTVQEIKPSQADLTGSGLGIDNQLPEDMRTALVNIFIKNLVGCANWLAREKWLPPLPKYFVDGQEKEAMEYLEQNLNKLSKHNATKIIRRPDKFLAAVQIPF